LFSACGRGVGKQDEVLYVTAAPQAALRDRVAPVYSKTGIVKNGDKVVVLEHGKRWERVRNEKGEEGWLQDRYLVGEDVFRGFQQLNRDHQKDPVQAQGVLRSDFRLHLTPGRDTDRLFLLKEGDKIDLLQRAAVSRAASSAPPPPVLQASAAATAEKSEEKQDASDAAKEEETEYKGKERPAAPAATPKGPSSTKKSKVTPKSARENQPAVPAVPMEDWWLVRTSQGHAGWVLGRMIDIDVPLDIAQYAEGQRIVSFFPLTSVHDPELNKDESYYLVLLTDPKDGMPFDFNQVRVFSWNVRKHRYETAYRDRNIFGLLPVSVGQEQFENVGTEPTFTIHVRDENGNTAEQKYRLEGVMVKRVLAPGETPVKAAPANPESRGRGRRAAK
jgi:SH3-like domain-containing protein